METITNPGELHECGVCGELTDTHVEVSQGHFLFVCKKCIDASRDYFIFICIGCGRYYKRKKSERYVAGPLLDACVIQGLPFCIECNPAAVVEATRGKQKAEA